MIIYVGQREAKDCGVAAIAMLCEVTYEEADFAIPRDRPRKYGTTTRQLIEGAAELGYRACGNRLRPLRYDKISWTGIEDNSLVKVPHPRGNGWHWVVWCGSEIYDPARGVFRPLFYEGGRPISRLRFISEGIEDCPECGTPTEAQWSGIKCPKCGWWFCY